MPARICPSCGKAIGESEAYQICSVCRRNYHRSCGTCPAHPTAEMILVSPTSPHRIIRRISPPAPVLRSSPTRAPNPAGFFGRMFGRQRERTASPPPPYTVVASNKSPITAALLSFFLFGGVGQIYLGQKKKGVALIVATFLTALFGLSFIVSLAGTIDAYGIAKKMNQGISVGDWEFSFSGKALIVILVIIGVIIGIVVLASIGTQTR